MDFHINIQHDLEYERMEWLDPSHACVGCGLKKFAEVPSRSVFGDGFIGYPNTLLFQFSEHAITELVMCRSTHTWQVHSYCSIACKMCPNPTPPRKGTVKLLQTYP